MRKLSIICFALILLLLAGCTSDEVQNEEGTGNSSNNTEENSNANGNGDGETESETTSSILEEPVTLTLWNRAMGIVDDEVAAQMFKPLQDKYPNVKIELLKDVNIEEMIAAGEVPDLIATSNYYLLDHIDMELAGDFSEFFEKNGLSLDQFNPAIVENLEVFAEITESPGTIYGMPVSMNQGVLIYNKDIFDQFGVDYPTPGMTWQEIIDLSREVTGNIGGTDYIGFSPGGVQTITRAQGLAVIDEEENAAIDTPEYKEAFEMLNQLYSIPGVVNGEQYNYNINFFMEERRLAMIPYWFAALTSRIPIMEETGVNWDVTSFPTTVDNPNWAREVDYHLFTVPETAKNREAAMAAVAELVTEEAQTYLGKEVLRLTVLDNEEVRNAYGEGSGLYTDKQMEEIFSLDPSPGPTPSLYDRSIYSILGQAQAKLAIERQDINTVLREAQEEAETKILEMKEFQ